MKLHVDVALARKSIKQSHHPSPQVLSIMENFRSMVNDCIRVGLGFERTNDKTPSMKQLSLLSYGELKERYDCLSQYRLTAISKAAGILSARKKSIKRGFATKSPYLSKATLVSCYDLAIKGGNLLIHLSPGLSESVTLKAHTLSILSDPSVMVRSFTLTENSLSLCISREVEEVRVSELAGAVGVDRNLRNLTVGNDQQVTYCDMAKVVEIAENTRGIVRSFRRNDVRIRRRLSMKYGCRRRERLKQFIHLITKDIVQSAKANKQAIVFEEIKGIRKLYQRGNGQRRNYRGKMNSWPFHEVKRQIEYKAAWAGVHTITLSRSETRGTTMDCLRCGERLQLAIRGDREHYRQLWCKGCKRWTDRDLAAVLNISRRGRLRFDRSQEGGAGEAVRRNPREEGSSQEPVILRVDASKLCHARKMQ